MNPDKGKNVALTALALGLLVVVGAGAMVFKDRLLENSYIQSLKRGDPRERSAAANKLGEMKSVKALPSLLDALREDCANLRPETNPIQRALIRVGKPALRKLIESLNDSDRMFQRCAGEAIKEIYVTEDTWRGKCWPSLVEVLEAVERDDGLSAEVRQAASKVVKNMQTEK